MQDHAMNEHKKPATERVTGTKTKPRLISAKVPPSRTNGRRSAHLPSVQGGPLRLAQRSAQGTLVLSRQPCRYRDPRTTCRTNIHLTRGAGMHNALGLL